MWTLPLFCGLLAGFEMPAAGDDWLLATERAPAQVDVELSNTTALPDWVSLGNGLVQRRWRIDGGATLVQFTELGSQRELIRAMRPQATLRLSGYEVELGGRVGQPNQAFLDQAGMEASRPNPNSAPFLGVADLEIEPRLEWKRTRHAPEGLAWPPAGAGLRFTYEWSGPEGSQLAARIHVNVICYDGLPAYAKWIEVENSGAETLRVERLLVEDLALVENANWVETRDGVALPRPDGLHVETDFAFGGFNHPNSSRHVVHWDVDPDYGTQVNYQRQQPCRLRVEPDYGPNQRVASGEVFESFRVFELAHDSTDRERRGLALRRFYRTIAPWVTENPLMHHLRVSDPTQVRRAIDDAADVGFEMVILSFGSGFNIENTDPEYIAQWAELRSYANSKGIELGGYSLLSSRFIGPETNVVSPEGQSPTHGNCPALTSEWGLNYLATLRRFFEATNFDLLEHDGPYPGDLDTTARPPLQEGLEDSRWAQWRLAADFYRWCRARGIYINAPDYYFLVGTNKCGMGYRETNWSLPRDQQVIHTRQNIYDGTWEKTPSMGWMFVPLSEYHGGGAAATIEPLDEHRDHYERMLVCNLALGVQACYRGPRLFDTQRVRDLVVQNVDWFKAHRAILESDLIHGRRADGRDVDWMLHVNPQIEECGMLVVFNPLKESVTRSLEVDLYYTGLTETASVTAADGSVRELPLARDYSIQLDVEIPARGWTWYSIR